MRFLHTADWHLGRIFYGQYLTDDQAHVLENQFFSILKDEKIDGIFVYVAKKSLLCPAFRNLWQEKWPVKLRFSMNILNSY